MGDRTQALVEVVGGSPAVRDALADVWWEYAGDYGLPRPPADDLLHGEDWVDEFSCGAMLDVYDRWYEIVGAAPLEERPDFIRMYEEARYEYLGDVFKYRPDLGWWSGEVDNSGDVDIPEEWLRATLESARGYDSPVDFVLASLDGLLGKAWDEES